VPDWSLKQRLGKRYQEGGVMNVAYHVARFGLNRGHSIALPFHNRVHKSVDGGIMIVDADWDNLLVLDACRADLFESVVETDQFDAYRTVRSKGSSTAEWLSQNFPDAYGDVVYVSGNPHTSNITSESFHDLIEVWRTDYDDDLGTVRHKPIIEAAHDAAANYPEKRLIVHFMQPHHPFIPRPDLQYDGWSAKKDGDGEVKVGAGIEMTPWQALESGVVERSGVWDAYRENLELVADDVLQLARDFPGKTVVTSDHGNAFGERPLLAPKPVFGHPPNVRLDPLVRVPWAVFDGKRKTIHDDGVTSHSDVSTDVIEKRLSELGYR